MSHTHHTYLKLLPRRPPLLMLMMHCLSSELGSQRILSPCVADFNLSVGATTYHLSRRDLSNIKRRDAACVGKRGGFSFLSTTFPKKVYSLM